MSPLAVRRIAERDTNRPPCLNPTANLLWARQDYALSQDEICMIGISIVTLLHGIEIVR